MSATLKAPTVRHFKLRVLPWMVGMALLAMSNQESLARSNETTAAFTATQLVRQFTLKNTVAQVNQGMQGYVQEVNGQLRSAGMGPAPNNYPAGMGSVPGTVNLPQRDGAGRPLGYCAWDNASGTSNANYLAGSGVANPLVHAVISPGLNGAIETTCAEILLNGVGNNDDYVLTTAPTQASSKQFRSSVGTEAELFSMTGENGDVRLVAETNRLYSYLNGAWSAIGPDSPFADDSAANGVGAISYTGGKVTVGDFQATSAVVTGVLSAGTLIGNGAGLTDLNMSNVGSGVLSAAFGGTGVNSSTASNGQLLIGNGSGYTLGNLTAGAGIGVLSGAGSITISNTGVTSLAGTPDQVIVSGATGDVTLSLPQAIGTTSSPTFGGLTLGGALNGSSASFSGNLSATTASVSGPLRVGSAAGTGNYLSFYGTPGDREVPYTHTYIGERLYGATEASELFLFKGNDSTAGGGPDRIRMAAGALVFSTYANSIDYLAGDAIGFEQRAQDSRLLERMRIDPDGKINMYGALSGTAGVFSGTVTASGFVGNGSALTSLNASNITTGTLPVARGGTGMDGSTAGNGQLLIGNGTGYTLANITGTANRVIVSNGVGSINLSLPQRIDLAAETSFGSVKSILPRAISGQGAYLSWNRVEGGISYGRTYILNQKGAGTGGIVFGEAATDGSDTFTRNVFITPGGNLEARGDLSAVGGTFAGAITANSFAGNGAAITNLNASNFTTGTVAVARGGTGVDGSTAGNGQLLIGNGSGYTLANITGTANQVNVTNGAGSITLSLPQNIATTSTPTFGGLTVNGVITANTATFSGVLTAGRLNLGSAAGGVSVQNLIIGNGAMPNTQSGLGSNTAIGIRSLEANNTGYNNVAVGEEALLKNTSGYKNTAIGEDSLFFNTTGSRNTAIGEDALLANTTGDFNTGVGKSGLQSNVTGSYNSSLGYSADVSSAALSYATAIGANAVVATSNTLVLGRNSNIDQIVLGADSRNDTHSNTKLYVNGLTHLNGELRGTVATFTGAVNADGFSVAGVPATLAFTYANSTGDPIYRDNLALGTGALAGDKRGGNLALGPLAMANLIGSVNTTDGTRNTAVGSEAMFSNQTGHDNVALGQATLFSNTTGIFNTALGRAAMFSNTSGRQNSAVGREALFYNTTGNFNTAAGNSAMFNNTSGIFNSAFGQEALYSNVTGNLNTAIGQSSLYNSTGSRNTSIGQSSLFANTVGEINTAVGQFALGANTTGLGNVAVGQAAMAGVVGGRYSTGVGQGADVQFNGLDFTTVIGAKSRASSSNTVVLGALAANKDAAVSTLDDQIVIGATNRNDTQQNTKLFVNGAVNITEKLFVNGVEITGSGSTNASDINSGLLGTAYGGTGINGSTATNGQLLIGNGSGYTLANITGTASQINVTNGAGSITLSLPQNIATTSTPTFGGLTLNGGVTGTTANYSGRVDVGSLYVGGEQLQAMTKTNIDAALTYASDTGDPIYTQPNLALGGGALSSNKRAGNVAIGASVLGSLSAAADGMMGTDNTGLGYRALPSVTTGYRNTAIGSRAAHAMTHGYANTAVGRSAAYNVTNGYENTAIGENALFDATSAYQNVAVGKSAMFSAGSAYENTAVGNNALLNISSGYGNVAVGRSALQANTHGFRNTGLGMEALRTNTLGSYNLGVGYRADVTDTGLTYAQAVGNMAQVSTSNTLVLGAQGVNKFGSSVDDQVVIGSTSRNDTHADTRLYVNGAINASGRLYAGSGEFTGRVQIATGLPNALHFGDNAENLDTTSIYRFNQASDQTFLRVRLSDNNQGFGTPFSDEFQIGYQDSGYSATFRVAGSGAVISSSSITATAFNTSSDRRLKNNLQVQDADTLLNKLSGLSAYSYEYAGQSDLGRRIGVIAQDMLPLFPEAVNVRPDGFYAVDYGALGALAAAGVGRLNNRVVELDKAFKESAAAQTMGRIETLEDTVGEHGQRIDVLESWKLSAETQLTKADERLGTLETWRTSATETMETMQTAIDLNIQKIAENAVAIQANTKAIERLDDALFTLDGRVKNNSDLINSINARWVQNFNASEDGSVLAVNAVELKVSNFTAQNMRANTVYSMRLEAEMARIAELEVNSLRADSAVANTVRAEQMNTGAAQVYAGAGLPAVLFSAKSDGHYTVNTSALDGSYATATVIVNAGQAKVITTASEGIELFADGNTVKAIAAGKSIKASWIKTG